MYYTSMIIIVGFSILILSNFLPTIYFGLFTGLAMFIALMASLTLLPHQFTMLSTGLALVATARYPSGRAQLATPLWDQQSR